ncbi:heme biosynthesis protein HemY [Methylovorus sp. MM2]|uniref:heme biosynthesis HemY N-terminal domain-containing protein n=1 Tax=Methylovorus sp. MM2 TaxID=1848038 RepID=UPI0007DEFFCE|nr:heme biosynthesis HemY N-terminal domain-containing protein [Methylovorus sp. MM2]OAM51951.1 heme biosynthesis protein HemY [Methylovorus sp. MM2]
MRWLFWILFIIALTIGVSLIAGSNEGYVLIVRPPYRIELSLNFLLVLIVLVFVSLHLGLRLVNYTQRLPSSVRTYKEAQRLKNGRNALKEALHALGEGHYQAAVKSATRALDLGESVGLSALVAARASHKLKQKSQRDYYLAEAERLAPQETIARLLTQAELFLDDRLYSHALNILQKLEKIEPRHPPALHLLLKVEIHLGHWEQVLNILQQLEKIDAIESWLLREMRQQAHYQSIKLYADDLATLTTYWKKLPEEDRLNSRLAYLAAQTFIQAKSPAQAAEILGKSLTKGWDTKLAGLLGECLTDHPNKQLEQAEYWLQNHEDDANLLLSLGKMCASLNLWGKAQSYFEASLSVTPSATAHLALAKLLETRGEKEAAYQHYRASTQFLQDAT